MLWFLSILLVAVLACALFFWSLETPDHFGTFQDALLKTLFTSFFGDFDPFTDVIDSRFKACIRIINIMVVVGISLICMNAMIAFISENFTDILENKIAVIAKKRPI